MRLSSRKRGLDGGDYGDPMLLGAVGLGNFARRGLPDAPDGLEIDAAYEYASDRIAVSVGGEAFSASAVDLAAALGLPPGPIGPDAGVRADFLSSAEAITAVGRFVRDCLLLGDGEECGAASEEVAAAMRLVEEGKAYEVDWAELVWAVLKGKVKAGTPGRFAPYLLCLLEYQKPELFAEVDERLSVRKRWKCRTLQPCQGEGIGEKLGISEEYEVQGDKQENSLAYALSPELGDLEEMPIFGEGRELTVAVPVDCKGTFLEQEEVHGVNQGHAELRSRRCSLLDAELLDSDTECDGAGINRLGANNQTFPCNSSFGWQCRAMDEQDDSSSPQQMISGTKSQPASNLQSTIEIDDDDDDDDDVGVGVGSAVIRNVPLEISPYPVQQHGQTLRSFDGCLQQMLVRVLCMEKGYSDKEKDCSQLQAEVQCLKKMVMEKEQIIEAAKCAILNDLRANQSKMYQFEKAKEVMLRSFQHYKKLVKKSSAEFQEYKSMMLRVKGVDSDLGVLGFTYEQKHALMQQLRTYCLWVQRNWSSKSFKLEEKVNQMAKDISNIEYEFKRLKESISIPDLNNGTGDDGEDKIFPYKSEGNARADERDLDSSSTQNGKHLGEMLANPAQIVNTEGSIDVNRVQVCSEDEACHIGASEGAT